MCHPVCGMMHIKDLLLVIGKNSPCSGSSRFPLFYYMTNVFSVLLNKIFLTSIVLNAKNIYIYIISMRIITDYRTLTGSENMHRQCALNARNEHRL